jgi:fucose 4-O-acetylase-like acetyltransferase
MAGRIDYIDSAKGICMLLVVMVHTGVPEPLPGLYELDVPAFFVFSGYFFRSDGGFRAFLMKKVWRLLVPFSAFYLLSYAVFYSLLAVYPAASSMTEARGILDLVMQKSWFNGPLWFLPCLFWMQLMAYLLCRVPGVVLRVFSAFSLGVSGLLLSHEGVYLPLALDTALTACPYFFAGVLCRHYGVFGLGRFSAAGACLLTTLVWLVSGQMIIGLSTNSYDGEVLPIYVLPSLFALSLVSLSRHLLHPWERLMPFIGRHTMYILCMHHLVYRPVKLVLSRWLDSGVEPYLTFVVTVMLCLFTAPCVERRLPWLLGQKQ